MFLQEKLKYLREKNKLSKKSIAEYLNVSQSTYGKYELGDRKPDIDMICLIADMYHISVDCLIGRDNKQIHVNLNDMFRKPLDEILSLNEKKPLWFKLINTSESREYNDIVSFTPDCKIELYDPLQNYQSGQRIYIDFYNALNNQYRDDAYDFFCKYGFLGRTNSHIAYVCDDINMLNAIFYQYSVDNEPSDTKAQNLRLIFNKEFKLANYLLADNFLYVNHEIKEQFSSDQDYSDCLKQTIARALADYRFWGKPDDDCDRKIGYYEKLDGYIPYKDDMHDVILRLNDNNIEGATKIINKYLTDICFQIAYIDNQPSITFIYKSLLSLMFLEFLCDIENEIYPVLCPQCKRNYVLAARGTTKLCDSCVQLGHKTENS
jgi:transcriptional regulator with XRE-family HTH domain